MSRHATQVAIFCVAHPALHGTYSSWVGSRSCNVSAVPFTNKLGFPWLEGTWNENVGEKADLYRLPLPKSETALPPLL